DLEAAPRAVRELDADVADVQSREAAECAGQGDAELIRQPSRQAGIASTASAPHPRADVLESAETRERVGRIGVREGVRTADEAHRQGATCRWRRCDAETERGQAVGETGIPRAGVVDRDVEDRRRSGERK